MKHHHYILGTDDEELQRLELQHQIWRAETRNLWEKADFQSGQHLVDVGCGPGLTSIDLLEIVGKGGSVTSVDSSERMTGILNRRKDENQIENLRVLTNDVHDLELEKNSMDGAFARWLFCYLDNPQSVVAAIARSLKPGGTLAIIDYFNYLAIALQPPNKLFDRIFGQVFESFRNEGGGLEIGQRLPGIMTDAGFDIRKLDPICGIGRPGSDLWRWVSSFLESYLPKLVQRDFLTDEELGAFRKFWKELEHDPGVFLFAPPMIGIVGRKAAVTVYSKEEGAKP